MLAGCKELPLLGVHGVLQNSVLRQGTRSVSQAAARWGGARATISTWIGRACTWLWDWRWNDVVVAWPSSFVFLVWSAHHHLAALERLLSCHHRLIRTWKLAFRLKAARRDPFDQTNSRLNFDGVKKIKLPCCSAVPYGSAKCL